MTLSHHTLGCLCSWCSAYKRGKSNVTTPTTTASAAEYADFIMDEVVERKDNPEPQVEVESSPAKRVLVIGPMTGHLDFNRPMFERAARAASDHGLIPTIPHQLDETAGEYLPGTDPVQFTVTAEARAGYLRRTARFLSRMDGVVVLPTWTESNGACAEVLFAVAFGLDFYRYSDVTRKVIPMAYPPALTFAFDGITDHALYLYHLGATHGPSGVEAATGHTNDRPGDPRFHALLKEIGDLHDRKQADYGRPTDPFANVRASVDFGIPPWVGSLVRANDKMRRLQKAAAQATRGEDIDLANEGVEDSFMDLAVYALIGHVLFNETEETE